jgi:alpha-L-fucosidase
VSKNGNLLLNIGPKPDGSLDEREVAILRSIGAWLETNGEAVYGTRPWIAAGEGPTRPVVGSFVDRAPIVWTGQDFRFTTKGDILYATWLARPQGTTLRVVSLGSDLHLIDVDVTEVTILGVDAPVTWKRTPSALEVELPDGVPDGLGVVRIHLQPVPLPDRLTPPQRCDGVLQRSIAFLGA